MKKILGLIIWAILFYAGSADFPTYGHGNSGSYIECRGEAEKLNLSVGTALCER
jgi:hypothetical protein